MREPGCREVERHSYTALRWAKQRYSIENENQSKPQYTVTDYWDAHCSSRSHAIEMPAVVVDLSSLRESHSRTEHPNSMNGNSMNE